MCEYLVILEGCSVNLGGRTVLKDIHFSLAPGARWAVFGRNGSGKTSLLRLIRGELHPPRKISGTRRYGLGGPGGNSPIAARRCMAMVSAEDQDARIRLGLNLTGEQVVLSGFSDSFYPPSGLSPGLKGRAVEVLGELGISHLAAKPFPEMSRGEARAVILARALAAEPRVLLLDEFLDGLDRETERSVLSGLSGPRFRNTAMVIASHRPERTPDFINEAALMDEGRIIKTGAVQEVAAAFSPPAPEFGPKENRAGSDEEFILRIKNATVRRKGRDVIKGLDLTLHPGEHLAVVGPNGSGKSTLLLLIMAVLRPLSGGVVEWFGGRGPAGVFEIRKRIGFVSPELQAGYGYDVSALEFVLSGLDASVGFYRQPGKKEAARATELIARAGLSGMEDRKIRSMSYGQLRRLLVARALAPEPELLLLDEAASGLDPAARAGLLEMLDHAAASGVGIIYATHHEQDLPGCVNRVLELGRGKAETGAL